jgi:hypothetical protein
MMDIVEWLRWNAKEQGSRFGEAADEIERLREALNGFEKTMSEATKTIKTLLNDLKIQTELKTRLEKICEKQHNILIANGIFPQENTKQ